MSIRWDDVPTGDGAHRIPIPVWHVPPQFTSRKPAYVRLLGPWRPVYLHWTRTGRKRSIACRKPAPLCPYCPDPSFRYGYAPAAWWRGGGGNNQEGWTPIVAGIPNPMMNAFNGVNPTGYLFAIWREAVRGDWADPAWNLLENHVKELPLSWFDMIPILNTWWRYIEAEDGIASKRDSEEAWRKDLADVVQEGPPAELAAPVAPPSCPPPPLPPPPPEKAPSTAWQRARARVEGQKQPQQPPETSQDGPAIIPFSASALPTAPATKKPRKSRKGGA